MGDLGQASGGSTPSTVVAEYWGGGIPWLVPSEVTRNQGLFISATERTITKAGLANSAVQLLPAGTVMMTSRATIGEVAINTVPMATNQGFINVVCNENVVFNEFLAFWIRHKRSVLIARSHGVTFKEITKPNFKLVPILLPPLPEQRTIAHVLRTVQAAKEARQREVALERERKAALMAHLFAHGTRGEPTKQTPIGEIPESWEVGKVGELAAIKGGKRLPKGVDFADDETRFPYIRVVDLANGSVKTDALKYLTTETQREIAQYIIRQADVYISIAGTIGLVGTIPPELDGANLTENAARLVIRKREQLSRDFLAAYLKGEGGQAQISSLTAKTTQPKLALARIAQIQIPLPLFAEQQQIAQILRACDATIAALERESSLLDELFRALLEELMTGRLSVAGVSESDD